VPDNNAAERTSPRNLLAHVGRDNTDMAADMFRKVFAQRNPTAIAAAWDEVRDRLAKGFPKIGPRTDAARADILAFAAFPKAIWRQIWSNNPQERLNREIRRRTDVVGIFPGRDALIRLVGAVLAEQHDEWAEMRRYIGLEVLAKSRISATASSAAEEVPLTAITA
jgi:putative transposase